jgi:hypothetical protein
MREFYRRYENGLRRVAVVVVFLAAWQLLPKVQMEIVDLHQFALNKFRNREYVAKEISTPLSGERRVLSDQTLTLLALVRAQKPETFRLSKRILASARDSQRIIESAWPIRFDEAARVELSLLSEVTSCAVIREQKVLGKGAKKQGGVRIALCP